MVVIAMVMDMGIITIHIGYIGIIRIYTIISMIMVIHYIWIRITIMMMNNTKFTKGFVRILPLKIAKMQMNH